MNDFPKVIEFQTHNLCNANCIICPYREIDKDAVFMSDKLFDRLLEGIGNRNILIIPYLNNEPFLDRAYCEKLKKINDLCPNCKIEISTNLSLINEEIIHKLEKVKIYEFRISVFGFYEDTYKKIMPGLNFKNVWNNLNILIKSDLTNLIPNISITMIEHKDVRKEEYFYMQKWCMENGIGFNKWGFLDRAGNNSFYNSKIMHQSVIGCEQDRPLQRMHILADGSVIICCQDWRKEVVLGNLYNSTIEEIWNGKKYDEVRKSIYDKDKKCINLCKKCKLSMIKKGEK